MLYIKLLPHLAHSSTPLFHSWYNPLIRIIINMLIVIIHTLVILNFMVKIIGSIIAISISKIKKSTAIKKNWIENGDRADLFGSKPHSNGDIFSRSFSEVFEIIVHNNIIINAIMIDNLNEYIII